MQNSFIEFMIDSGVLMFGDFITKSGRKTPYFINAGKYDTGAKLARLGEFYADAIAASGENPDVLFGPAYKGIPICAASACALFTKYGIDTAYSFNRKEAKDHGEGGSIVGYMPRSGDKIAIIEDVTTAGTSIRETAKIFRSLNLSANITSLFVTIDRMERGKNTLSAFAELRAEFGINIYAIATVRDIIAHMETAGKDTSAIDAYLAEFGAQ
ncbi:MAG: orotate phosphoribosyltransferase [Oscillospiraceae bacterium]|jgi:orotate phosphoribosyltransferase|nr:orotate phosphoribosyltransferase [Oscillospiraceae bacterium]